MQRKVTIGVACVLAAAVAIAYANSFAAGFVFDDTYGLVQNPAIRSLANIPRFFTDPTLLTIHKQNLDVRPVLQITFALNYAISGLAPWSWRALNLLLHFAACLLVFVIVRDHAWWPRERSLWPAAAAALVFALSPLNQQAVVYLWARSALLCTVLYLAAFLAWLERRTAICCILFLLALLTKTIAVTLPAVIVAYELIDRGSLRRLPALLAVLVAFLAYRAYVLHGVSPNAHDAWVTPWIWLMTQWSAYVYYVRLFLWPDALSIDHSFPYNMSLFTLRTLGSLAVLLLWAGFALRNARRWPTFAFGTAWYFLALATESSVMPLSETVNDHRPYLPSSLGLALLLVWLLDAAARRFTPRPALALGAATAVLGAAAIPVIVRRNFVFQDTLRLWVATAESDPGNGRAVMNAGQEMMARGRLAEARAYFDRALAIMPSYSFLHINRSVLADAEGNSAEAVREGQVAVGLDPGLGLAHQYLGQALLHAGRRDEAAAELRRAVELSPELTGARTALQELANEGAAQEAVRRGLEAVARRDDEAAVAAFGEALSRDPSSYQATRELALALDRLGRRDAATALWRALLPMALRRHDEPAVQQARTRLGQPE